MRRSLAAIAGLAVLAGYVHRRSDSEPIVAKTAAADVRVVGPVRAAIASPPRPTLVEHREPVLDLIDPDGAPPLPPAAPRTVHGWLLALDGAGAIGATVVVTSPNLRGEEVVITDENGYFAIDQLPIGEYAMTIYYNNRTYNRSSLDVNDREATAVEEVLDPSDSAPDPVGDVAEGTPLEVRTYQVTDQVYEKNIPVPARVFEAVLGVAAGSQGDSYGTSLTDATSQENVYVVDEANDERQVEPDDPTDTHVIGDRGGM